MLDQVPIRLVHKLPVVPAREGAEEFVAMGAMNLATSLETALRSRTPLVPAGRPGMKNPTPRLWMGSPTPGATGAAGGHTGRRNTLLRTMFVATPGPALQPRACICTGISTGASTSASSSPRHWWIGSFKPVPGRKPPPSQRPLCGTAQEKWNRLLSRRQIVTQLSA